MEFGKEVLSEVNLLDLEWGCTLHFHDWPDTRTPRSTATLDFLSLLHPWTNILAAYLSKIGTEYAQYYISSTPWLCHSSAFFARLTPRLNRYTAPLCARFWQSIASPVSILTHHGKLHKHYSMIYSSAFHNFKPHANESTANASKRHVHFNPRAQAYEAEATPRACSLLRNS